MRKIRFQDPKFHLRLEAMQIGLKCHNMDLMLEALLIYPLVPNALKLNMIIMGILSHD
jgi:hypothetical protein